MAAIVHTSPVLDLINLGSSSLKRAGSRIGSHDRIEFTGACSANIRCGADVFPKGSDQKQGGFISGKTVESIIEALNAWNEARFGYESQLQRLAIATSAPREAANWPEVRKEIFGPTGVAFFDINGNEEGRLMQLATSAELRSSGVELQNTSCFCIDYGGGSTEIGVLKDGEPLAETVRSLKCGSMRLLKDCSSSQITSIAHTVDAWYQRVLAGPVGDLLALAGQQSFDMVAASGGNPGEFGKLQRKLTPGHTGQILTRADLAYMVDLLSQVPLKNRASEFAIEPSRAEVIVPSGMLLLHLLDQLGAQTLYVVQSRVPHALGYEAFGSHLRTRDSSDYEQAESFAVQTCSGAGLDTSLATVRANFCTCLFDTTLERHKLPPRFRRLLRLAAYVQDIGQGFGDKNQAQLSFKILRTRPFFGLSGEDRSLVNLLVQYARKGEPQFHKLDHMLFPGPNDRENFRKCCALLQFANGLADAIHDSVAHIELSTRGNDLLLTNRNGSKTKIIRSAAESSGRLMTRLFHYDLQVKKSA